MKIVVAYNWGADPQEASVGADGKVDFSRAKPVVGEYDAVAIEVGRRLADSVGAVLIGVTVGGPAAGSPLATRAALSRGLDSVIAVCDPALESVGTTRVCRALAAVVSDLGDVGLVLTGDSSIDTGARMVAAVLGGLLGWPTVTDASAITIADHAVQITRRVPEGRQALFLEAPAVIAVDSAATSPKVPGMKDILTAAKKPVSVVNAADVGLGPAPEGTTRSAARLTAPARRGVVIDATDPAGAAAVLVDALRAGGLVIGGNR